MNQGFGNLRNVQNLILVTHTVFIVTFTWRQHDIQALGSESFKLKNVKNLRACTIAMFTTLISTTR